MRILLILLTVVIGSLYLTNQPVSQPEISRPSKITELYIIKRQIERIIIEAVQSHNKQFDQINSDLLQQDLINRLTIYSLLVQNVQSYVVVDKVQQTEPSVYINNIIQYTDRDGEIVWELPVLITEDSTHYFSRVYNGNRAQDHREFYNWKNQYTK